MTEQERARAADLRLQGLQWHAIAGQLHYHPDVLSREVAAVYGGDLRLRHADTLARAGVGWPEIARRTGYADRGTARRSVHQWRQRQRREEAHP